MNRFDDLDKYALRELLTRNWMTHDAMWFFHTLQANGIDAANALNRAAVRSMAAVEAKRLKKALGVDEIRTFAELESFVVSAFEVIRGSFMSFRLSFPEEGIMRWEVPSCFAHDGVQKLGVIQHYQCGIFERFDAWLEALGVPYTATPEVKGCLLHEQGRCARTYRFNFSPATPADRERGSSR